MSDHTLTVRIPHFPDPAVEVINRPDSEFVTLEWRYGDVIKRESLHRAELLAALGAGAPAESITTPEELDALPADDVLLRASGRYRYGGGTFTDCWVRPVPSWITGTEAPRAWEVLTYGATPPESMVQTGDITLPVEVLYRPDAPTPPAEDREALNESHSLDKIGGEASLIAECRRLATHPNQIRHAVPHFFEMLADALAARQPAVQTVSAERSLVALSEWIDAGNANRDPEAVTWGRLAKITEEAGEVIAAFIGATGQNPRKGVTHTRHQVEAELLDVAVTALGALEHLRGHDGTALDALAAHVVAVATRAGVVTP